MLNIGEFSNLCQVTTKTLRHYDQIGILKPIGQNEENGYRYYGAEQLLIMLKILRFKDYGFSLEEIKALFSMNEDGLQIAMEEKAKQLEIDIQKHTDNLAKLKNDITDLQKGEFMKQQLNITLVETKTQNIVSVREIISIKDFPQLMKKLFATGLPCEGSPIAIYHCPDFNPDCTDVEVGYPTNAKSPKTRTLDGGLCAKATHYGDYSKLHETYMAIGKWIEENKFAIAAPPYEVYINDPKNTPKEKLITEVYFPVKK